MNIPRIDIKKWSFNPPDSIPFNARHVLDVIEDQTAETLQLLAGRLVLPDVVKIRFFDPKSDDDLGPSAECGRRGIYINNQRMLPLLFSPKRYEASRSIFRGIFAHELSHLSDQVQKNPARHNANIINQFVAEGKAEHVALAVSGAPYKKQYITELDQCAKAFAYTIVDSLSLPWYVSSNFMSATAEFSGSTTSHNFDAPSFLYLTGYSMVGDTIEATNRSIFDIHQEHPDYFFDTVRQAWHAPTSDSVPTESYIL